jgi:AraC-like DNA-binding protein
MDTRKPTITIREIVYNEVGSSYFVPQHIHNLYQWYCVVYGSVDFKVGDTTNKMNPNDSILISPGMLRSPKYRDRSLGYFYVLFENHSLKIKYLSDVVVSIPNEFQNDLSSLIHEINKPEENTVELVEALIIRLLIGLERSQKINTPIEYSSNLNIQSKKEIVEGIETYMQRNLHHNLSRKELSNVFHLSPSHLARVFRNTTGTTLSRRLIEFRINRAKQLLLESSLPISEISLQVGYTSFSHFAQIFRQETGVSPGDYRRSQGNIRRNMDINQ